MTYRIVRMFFKDSASQNYVVKRGLTLEQAKAHCRNKETSSSTCRKIENVERTRVKGPWFDGYEKEE